MPSPAACSGADGVMRTLHGVDHLQVVVRDLEMAKRTWARLGFTVTPRGRHQGRGTGNYCVVLPEGDATLRFRLVTPADGTVPGIRAFVCHHTTPELTRRPAWLAHANQVIQVQSYTLAAEDPAPIVEFFGRWFGRDAVTVNA